MITRRLLALPVAVWALAASGCAMSQPPASASASSAAGTVSCQYRPGRPPAKPVDPPSATNVPATGTSRATIDFGDARVEVELDRAAAPCTVHSFESLAAQGFYSGSSCHRLSTQGIFILQCGDPTGTGSGGPGYTFNDELTQTKAYPAGTLAMANSGGNTNGSQFFFVYADTPLPPNYTVFGRLDAANNQVIADRAFQGHDASLPDGTGKPNLPTTIKAVIAG